MSNKLKKNKPAGEQEEPWKKKKEKDQPAWKKHLQVLIIALVLVILSVLTSGVNIVGEVSGFMRGVVEKIVDPDGDDGYVEEEGQGGEPAQTGQPESSPVPSPPQESPSPAIDN